MIWSLNQIKTALSVDSKEFESSKFNISLFDPIIKIGIGTQGTNKVIFIAPSQENVPIRETKNVFFNPSLNFTWEEENTTLNNLSMLICTLDKSDSEVLDAVSAVFFGLLELVLQNKEIGLIILELMELFDSGFKSKPTESSVIGLMGELLFINYFENSSKLIDSWHVSPTSNYDFSVNRKRLEIKCTSGTKRFHNFSSSQLPVRDDQEIRFISINLPVVSIGTSISQIYSEICSKLEIEQKNKLFTLICKTLKFPPEIINEPKFDVESAINSIKVYEPDKIPTPIMLPGISFMNWTAELQEQDGEDCNEIIDWLFNS